MSRHTNDEIKTHTYDEKYNLVEFTEDGAYHNGNFIKTSHKFDPASKTDCYISHFLQSNQIIEYFNTHKNEDNKNSIAGYNGDVWLKELVIDFDIKEEEKQEDLEVLLSDLRKFLRYMESEFYVHLNHIKINFSGRKGFHLMIPSILFGGFQPSRDLPNQIKNIAIKLTNNIISFDKLIYNNTWFIRVVNSKNSKSGLYAIPLTIKEIFALSIDEIKELAKNPRTVEYISSEELLPNPELIKLKNGIISEPHHMRIDFSKIEAKDPIWWGVTEGNRHKSLASIVGYLLFKKLPPNKIHPIVMHWNKSCRPPENERTVSRNVDELIEKYGNAENTFWTIDSEGKVSVLLVEFRKYLEEEGFAKFYLGNDYMFVQVRKNRIKEVTQNIIKDHVLSYIRSLDLSYKEQIEEIILQRNSYLLGENLIECISTIEPILSTDSKDKATFFFNNTVVEVTADAGIIHRDYEKSIELVWESHIIKKDFELLDRSLIENKSDFEKFLFNVSGRDDEHFKSFKSAIGYLLHSYKDSANAKVVVLCDQKVTEFPDGRTGKSLFGKALSKIKRAVRIDGKNFDFNSRFTFQQVDLDTQILEFNDVKKDFDFENLFSVITDDMTIENKGQRPFQIPFDKSPKILASTNFTINGLGSSFRDRLFEIEFSDFYNEQHRPIDDFGKRFFDDWDQSEWNRFYNFMFDCVLIYLREGLILSKNQNLQLRKIIDATSREFVEFMDEQNIKTDGEDKKVLYERFQHDYPDYLYLRQNTFTKWIKSYCNIKGYTLQERRSSGRTYIFITK